MEQIHRITQAYSQTPWRKQVRMIGIFLLGVVDQLRRWQVST